MVRMLSAMRVLLRADAQPHYSGLGLRRLGDKKYVDMGLWGGRGWGDFVEGSMFVTTKTHQAAIREKDEQIEGLMKRLSSMEARLVPFERTRGKGGRFVSSKPDHDVIRAQFESECG